MYKEMAAVSRLQDLTCIPLDQILAAKARISNSIIKTPLIPLNYEVPGKQIYLKLENLQPTGSFKLRGACNATLQLSPRQLQDGVWSASAGNFAQALAWNARHQKIPCEILVPDSAPEMKVSAIARFGATVTKVPFDAWWNTIVAPLNQQYGMKGNFIHPVCNKDVIAGNGTIGLELFNDLPEVDSIICPYGGGGLSTGIASSMKALKPEAKVYACEVEVAAPLAASFKAGRPTAVEDYQSNFVDGMSGKALLPEMWGLARNLLHGPVELSLEAIASAVKLLAERNKVIAEGAGAAPVAAALTDSIPDGNIVCIISGGNIDIHKLTQILQDKVPN